MTTNFISLCELIVASQIFKPEGNELQSPIVRRWVNYAVLGSCETLKPKNLNSVSDLFTCRIFQRVTKYFMTNILTLLIEYLFLNTNKKLIISTN